MRILIVEDEAKIRASTKRALVEEGFNVVEAKDGETGLHLAATEEFDLIILDVMLPLRDGWSVVKARSGKGEAGARLGRYRRPAPILSHGPARRHAR